MLWFGRRNMQSTLAHFAVLEYTPTRSRFLVLTRSLIEIACARTFKDG
jgi:hypothetical protein